MLLSLNIKNAALISSLQLDFDKGLNILSGETGAGKTIIIDSLSFALGSKSDKSLIRHNEKSMSVEAVFDISKNKGVCSYLKEMGIEDETVILFRSLTVEGRNEIRINGRAGTLSMLKDISSRLVDIYGQSEHISLLKPLTHITLLDGYGKTEITGIKEEIKGQCREYKKVLNELKSYGGNQRERERLIDLYRYQIEEIENAKLVENEEEEIVFRRNILINIEKLTNETGEAQKYIDGGQYNLLGGIAKANSLVMHCIKYDESLSKISDRLSSVRIELEDINSVLNEYIFSLEYDNNEADNIEKRLDIIKSLKRKYGKDTAEIFKFLSDIKAELSKLGNSSRDIENLNVKKVGYEKKLYDLSLKLSGIRKSCAKKLENEILKNLDDLSMKGSDFKAEFAEFPSFNDIEDNVTENGMDTVEFYISPNKGEPLKPLALIISGGEMSRFMLAIKSIISGIDEIDTLIFDEIDTGISGVTAASVAKKFAGISIKQQIIAITHLPQIAAMADFSFLITKSQQENSTRTFISRLNSDQKVDEIARLIGAADIGTHAALHAKELINWSDNYKKELK